MATSAAPPPEAVRGGVSKTVFMVIVVIVAVIAFLGGVGLSPVLIPGSPAKLAIVVGTNTPFPPFERKNPTTGVLEGIDIDLMNEVGKRNGWDVVWRDVQDWDALLAAIKFRGVDVGASSITSNLPGASGVQRNASFDFSSTYYRSDQAVLIKTGTTAVRCAAAQCTASELANHTVAVQTLTSSHSWIKDNLVATMMTPESMVKTFQEVTSVMSELLNGGVEWVLIDKPIAENYARANPSLTVAGTILTNELYAFAVADGDPMKLIPKINGALDSMRSDGTFTRIMNKWLGG